MKTPFFKKFLLIKILNDSFINLPSPSNINTLWNFGSLLGLYMMIQIITGIFLTMHYTANTELAFNSVINICRNINYGWLIRTIHTNSASFFFIGLYLHIGRGMYYESFYLIETWLIGVIILFLSMMTAFMGYVLPWGQMSLWGATVITNLLSTIPYFGEIFVQWLWGGFTVNNSTLTRFYTFHFLLPFIIIFFIIIHLMSLHHKGSNNPLGVKSDIDKVPFFPYFLIKDLLGYIITLFMLTLLTLIDPYSLSDPDNFTPANSLVTPIHIQPEWYFLFAYTILRSIPNKLGGVIALMMSILIIMFLPMNFFKKIQGNRFYPINKILMMLFISIIILLTWAGAYPIEPPFIIFTQILTCSYFFYYFFMYFASLYWDAILFN